MADGPAHTAVLALGCTAVVFSALCGTAGVLELHLVLGPLGPCRTWWPHNLATLMLWLPTLSLASWQWEASAWQTALAFVVLGAVAISFHLLVLFAYWLRWLLRRQQARELPTQELLTEAHRLMLVGQISSGQPTQVSPSSAKGPPAFQLQIGRSDGQHGYTLFIPAEAEEQALRLAADRLHTRGSSAAGKHVLRQPTLNNYRESHSPREQEPTHVVVVHSVPSVITMKRGDIVSVSGHRQGGRGSSGGGGGGGHADDGAVSSGSPSRGITGFNPLVDGRHSRQPSSSSHISVQHPYPQGTSGSVSTSFTYTPPHPATGTAPTLAAPHLLTPEQVWASAASQAVKSGEMHAYPSLTHWHPVEGISLCNTPSGLSTNSTTSTAHPAFNSVLHSQTAAQRTASISLEGHDPASWMVTGGTCVGLHKSSMTSANDLFEIPGLLGATGSMGSQQMGVERFASGGLQPPVDSMPAPVGGQWVDNGLQGTGDGTAATHGDAGACQSVKGLDRQSLLAGGGSSGPHLTGPASARSSGNSFPGARIHRSSSSSPGGAPPSQPWEEETRAAALPFSRFVPATSSAAPGKLGVAGGHSAGGSTGPPQAASSTANMGLINKTVSHLQSQGSTWSLGHLSLEYPTTESGQWPAEVGNGSKDSSATRRAHKRQPSEGLLASGEGGEGTNSSAVVPAREGHSWAARLLRQLPGGLTTSSSLASSSTQVGDGPASGSDATPPIATGHPALPAQAAATAAHGSPGKGIVKRHSHTRTNSLPAASPLMASLLHDYTPSSDVPGERPALQ